MGKDHRDKEAEEQRAREERYSRLQAKAWLQRRNLQYQEAASYLQMLTSLTLLV
jgi:hypothetical protein